PPRHPHPFPTRRSSDLTEGARPKVAFVVPGQGAQWTGMGRELMAREPAFRAALERCDAAARKWIDWSIAGQLALDPGAPGYQLRSEEHTSELQSRGHLV